MNIVERLRHADRKCGDEHPDIELDWEAANEIERLRQQVEALALVARGAAYRIEDAKKSQRFLAMIDKAVGGK